MKRFRWLFFMTIIFLTGCGQNIPIENLAITLILGIDLDENNEFIFAELSPMFNEDEKKNVDTYVVKARSIRDSRKYFDALETGNVTAAKIQILLIGKKILEQKHWYRILDTIYRNPNFSLNSNVVMVDGDIRDIILYDSEEKSRLALHLKEVIENNVHRTRTINSTLITFHRALYGKEQTAMLPRIYKDKNLIIEGTALLDQNGKYVGDLSIQQTSLLLILRNEKNKELTLSLPLTSLKKDDGIFSENEISMEVFRAKRKIKSTYENGKFHFDIDIKLTGNIVEHLFPLDGISQKDLEKAIEKQLQLEFQQLIDKIQQNQIDPIGLGIYARAFHYDQYKKVNENWGKELSKAKISVNVEFIINSMGAVR